MAHSRGKNKDHLQVTWKVRLQNEESYEAQLPSRIRKLCSRLSSRTSRRRSIVAVIPVGLQPYYSKSAGLPRVGEDN